MFRGYMQLNLILAMVLIQFLYYILHVELIP